MGCLPTGAQMLEARRSSRHPTQLSRVFRVIHMCRACTTCKTQRALYGITWFAYCWDGAKITRQFARFRTPQSVQSTPVRIFCTPFAKAGWERGCHSRQAGRDARARNRLGKSRARVWGMERGDAEQANDLRLETFVSVCFIPCPKFFQEELKCRIAFPNPWRWR